MTKKQDSAPLTKTANFAVCKEDMRHETPLIEVSNQNTNSNEFNLARLNTTNIFLVISVACFSYSQCFSSKLFLKLFWTSFSEKGKTKLNKNVSKKKTQRRNSQQIGMKYEWSYCRNVLQYISTWIRFRRAWFHKICIQMTQTKKQTTIFFLYLFIDITLNFSLLNFGWL